MKIVLYTEHNSPLWSPDSLNLNYTQKCIFYLAKYLAKRSHKIWVVGKVNIGEWDNVKYRTLTQFKSEEIFVDTIISVNYTNYTIKFSDFKYNNSVLWIHDINWNKKYKQLLSNPTLKHIICLTYWHKDKWTSQFPETTNKTLVIKNGIEYKSFTNIWPTSLLIKGRVFPDWVNVPRKIPNQFIYTSHPQNCLAKVLEDWPSIKSQLPNAILKICTPKEGLKYFEENFSSLILNLEDVEFLGILSQSELYQLMAQSHYWYYPSKYDEPFCITALEMLGHKVQPITSEWGGLKETLHGFNTKNFNEYLDWSFVKLYLFHIEWNALVQSQWIPVLNKINMNLHYFTVVTSQIENNQPLYDKSIHFSMPHENHTYNLKKHFSGNDILPEELAKFGVNKHPNWQIENTDNPKWDHSVTDLELGKALSHVDTWVDAYCYDQEITLVLEDTFHSQLLVDWEKVNLLIENGYDLIYLGRTPLKPELESEIPEIKGWVEPDYSYGSHAYILSRKGVQILVEEYIDQYKSKIFDIEEFLSITFGMTYRQDILAEYEGKTRLKAAAPIINFIESVTPQSFIESTQSNDWQQWCLKYINPYLLNEQHRLTINEVNPNILELSIFTPEFYNEINQHKTDMLDTYQKVLEQFVYPLLLTQNIIFDSYTNSITFNKNFK
jgi:glycosyltransferase involved in cell wall biosynthesis